VVAALSARGAARDSGENADSRAAPTPFRGDQAAEAIHGGAVEAGRFGADEATEELRHLTLARAEIGEEL
jgi:hypothetical protein